jgi:predicted RNase H-related nuclease YkuK (DUF458 family)
LQWLLKKVSLAEKNKSIVSDKEQLTEDIVKEVIGRLSSKM